MSNKKINIGILQGRLSQSPKNVLQKFPNRWSEEFNHASKIGYDYIEFFSERNFNKKNPVWSKNLLKEYKINAKKNNLRIYSFVDDFIINNNFTRKKILPYYKKLINNLAFLKIKILILPFYEKSKITKKNYKKFIPNLDKICRFSNLKKIKVLIESNFSPELFFSIKEKIKSKNLYILFDAGNRINLKRNFYKDLLAFNKQIKHVHIKDKNNKIQNVILGNGNVKFFKFFKYLKKINYSGYFTIESTRANKPLITAHKNLNYVRKLLKKTSFY